MADYKFDKPWAAESQNVQDFTEQEWGTGIVEKSLVSSSQVNGVMQAVTKRFLDLEAVEDRQYRYDFIVENQAEWNKFINDNLGNAQSVLIRKGQVWTATNAVTLRRVGVIAQEEGAEIRFNGGLNRLSLSPAIISGGVIRGDMTNCRVLYATITTTTSAIYENTVFENSYVYTESSTVSLSRGHYSRSVINAAGKIMNAKLTDCRINNVKELENCTIVRCEIPNDTKLTDCTVIDCGYIVTTYTANLVTGTTFRNCNISFSSYSEDASTICDATNRAYGSTIRFHVARGEHVAMLVYDSEIKYYSEATAYNPLRTSSQFFGTSYMDVAGVSDTDLVGTIKHLMYGSIMTDIPFFRNGSRFRTYNSTDTIYPGVINIVSNNNTRNPSGVYFNRQKFFLRFLGNVSTTSITYGRFRFTPWCEYTQTANDDSYNLEFIVSSRAT